MRVLKFGRIRITDERARWGGRGRVRIVGKKKNSSIQRGGYTLLVRITTSEFKFREPKFNEVKEKNSILDKHKCIFVRFNLFS